MAITAAFTALGFAQPSIALPGLAPSTPAKAGKIHCRHVSASEMRHYAETIWPLILWERGKPKPIVIRSWRGKLRCAAGPGHRKAGKDAWRKAQRAFYEHRRAKLVTLRWEPYVCGDRRYALPCAVTGCESGYYFGHHSGAYGILDSTWVYWGGGRFAPYPGAATPRQQAIVARTVWEAVGPSGWECPL